MEYKIAEIGQVVGGGTPSTKEEKFWNGNIPWISPKDLTNHKSVYISSGENFITEEGLRVGSTLLPKNTVLMSSRAPIGYLAIAKNSICTNQGFKNIICDEKKVQPLYLYYYLKANIEYIKLYGTGATFPEISATTLRKIKINIEEDLATQRRIASILSAYDSLIENNNKRISILEQMAENLYKEWFVRFRFPGYETSAFENGIPKGWKREKLGAYYDTCSGGTPSRSNDEYYLGGTIPWVKTGEIKDCIIIDTEEHITETGIKKSSAKILPKGAVAMAMYGVNIGMLAYLDSEMSCNQACCVFSDKNDVNSRHFLFHYLYSIRDFLLSIGFGAAQQNLSQDLIKKLRIMIPPIDLIKKFDEQKEHLYKMIKSLMHQTNSSPPSGTYSSLA